MLSYINLFGYAASSAVLATFCMKTMQPLRILAVVSNVLFAAYGFMDGVYPVLVLHIVLFPINLMRLVQVHRLARRVASAAASGLSMTELLPFMIHQAIPAGTIVFRKGDAADGMHYIDAGQVEIVELGLTLGAGEVFGEIGLFVPDQRRTATVIAAADCDMHVLSAAKARELYFQDPGFAFAVLRLITVRLLENAERYAPRERPAAVEAIAG